MKHQAIISCALALSALPVYSYRYDDYSQGRSFFSDGQEWKFTRHDKDGLASEYEVTAKVQGDTAISYYMDYYGEIVRIDQPSKIIRVISEDPQVSEKRYAAYEWDAEIYVYSDKAQEFVQLLTFNKKEGMKILYNGEKWQFRTVDYIYPADRLMKRCCTGAMYSDKTSDWIYRIGADHVWLTDTKWENPGMLQLVSYFEPEGNITYPAEVFETETFTPDNLYYPEGKEWVYCSAYYEKRGENNVFVHQTVEEPMEFEHVSCKKASYRIEGKDSSETAPVCSHDGVMYERGYMGMLSPRFDFRLSKGDHALPDAADSEVTAVDRIEVNGEIRRRLTFRGLQSGSHWQYWVEGIGANSGNDMLPRDDETEGLSEIYFPGTFVRCEENGVIKFSASDFDADSSGLHTITDEKEADGEKVYRIDGIRVPGHTPGAIMVKSGRKYLLR